MIIEVNSDFYIILLIVLCGQLEVQKIINGFNKKTGKVLLFRRLILSAVCSLI